MASKKFDSMSWFTKNGAKATVTVKVPLTEGEGDFKFKLSGELDSITADSIAELAGAQEEDVKVSLPKVITDGGISVTRSKSFDGEMVSDMVLKTEEFFTADKEEEVPAK